MCILSRVLALLFAGSKSRRRCIGTMSEQSRNYESMMVLSAKLGEEGIKSIIEKFKDLISQNAVLKSVDDWGKRKLAYPINYENEGYYVLFNFESKADFPSELDRVYNITDGVIRTLIVSKEV